MDMQRILDLPVTVECLNLKIKFSLTNDFQQSAEERTDLGYAILDTEEDRINSNAYGSTHSCRNRRNFGVICELLAFLWKLYCALGSVITDSSLPTLIATVDLKSNTM